MIYLMYFVGLVVGVNGIMLISSAEEYFASGEHDKARRKIASGVFLVLMCGILLGIASGRFIWMF